MISNTTMSRLTEVQQQTLAELWQCFDCSFATPDFSSMCSVLDLGDPETLLPQFAEMLWFGNEQWRSGLEAIFLELATKLSVSAWPRVDEKIRAAIIHRNYAQNYTGALSPALILVALCHPSGRVREQTILQAASLAPQLRARLLLIRVNDWVDSVQRLAASEFQLTLNELDARGRVVLLPLIERLRQCGRHRFASQIEAWKMALATPWNENAWLDTWRNAKGKERRIFLEGLKQAPGLPGAQTRKALFDSNDRLALFWYLRDILPHLPPAERTEAYALLANAKAVPVRREWLQYLVETEEETAAEKLREHLFHPSRGIRQFARFHLTRLAPLDFMEFYLAALGNERMEAAALVGLREVSSKDAHREALARLDSQKPAVRCAALEALDIDAIGDHIDRLIAEAGSNMSGVQKVARRRLLESVRLFGTHLLVNPDCWSRMDHTLKVRAIRCAYRFQKWDGLEFLLLHAREPEFRDDTETSLEQWKYQVNFSYIRLSNPRREHLAQLLEVSGLPTARLDYIRFILDRSV